MSSTTWDARYRAAAGRLGSKLEARRLVERAASSPWPQCLDEPVSARAEPFFEALVERRAGGEPLQYVVGSWGFRGLDLMVDRRVLIPRPETEQVVEVALAEARAAGAGPGFVAADLGTGSGAIALALADELPGVEVWGTDASEDAIAVARANLAGLGTFAAGRVRLAVGSWFSPIPAELRGRLDLVVSNPPYVGDDEELPDEVARWEPSPALRAGPEGVEAIAAIVAEAPQWLSPAGALVIEIAPHQAKVAMDLARAAGFTAVEVRDDLAGRPRTLLAKCR